MDIIALQQLPDNGQGRSGEGLLLCNKTCSWSCEDTCKVTS